MLKWFLLALLLSTLANSVSANCWYNGAQYPEGTVIGPYVCSGGQWIRK